MADCESRILPNEPDDGRRDGGRKNEPDSRALLLALRSFPALSFKTHFGASVFRFVADVGFCAVEAHLPRQSGSIEAHVDGGFVVGQS
jgi:hypothetical protein